MKDLKKLTREEMKQILGGKAQIQCSLSGGGIYTCDPLITDTADCLSLCIGDYGNACGGCGQVID